LETYPVFSYLAKFANPWGWLSLGYLQTFKIVFKKSALVLSALVTSATVFASVETDALVTSVEATTGKATSAFVAACGLGIAALLVTTIVRMSKKGWKL